MQSVIQWAGLVREFVSTPSLFPVILGLIEVESGGDSQAKSSANAIGLMQVVGKWHGATEAELRDPRTNVRIGVRYLFDLMKRFGDLELALSAYNWGPTALSKLLSEGQGIPNRTYVDKVIAAANRYGNVPFPPLPMKYILPVLVVGGLILGAVLIAVLKD